VRGLALCQGALGCLTAFLLLVLVRSPGGDTSRAVLLGIGAVVLGAMHLCLLALALSQREDAMAHIRRMAMVILVFVGLVLLVGALLQPSNGGPALAVGIFMPPMPIALVILLRRSHVRSGA
jgi:predicted tellurium resistance membrane protein TerC